MWIQRSRCSFVMSCAPFCASIDHGSYVSPRRTTSPSHWLVFCDCCPTRPLNLITHHITPMDAPLMTSAFPTTTYTCYPQKQNFCSAHVAYFHPAERHTLDSLHPFIQNKLGGHLYNVQSFIYRVSMIRCSARWVHGNVHSPYVPSKLHISPLFPSTRRFHFLDVL